MMGGAAAAAPFPWVPVSALAFISFASCFSVTYVFPIVPYIVLDLGMVDDAREPGLYAVYLSSASMFGSMLSGIPWGRFADRYGRTLPLRIGMIAVAISSVLFGFS